MFCLFVFIHMHLYLCIYVFVFVYLFLYLSHVWPWFCWEVDGLSTLDRLEVIILIVEVRWSPPAFQHHTTHNTTEHKKSFQIQRMWFVYLSKSSFYRAMISPSHIGRFFPSAPQSILKGECKVNLIKYNSNHIQRICLI